MAALPVPALAPAVVIPTPDLHDFKYSDLFKATEDEISAVAWCQNNGLIAKDKMCVSTSMSVQRVMQESTQLADVINQASHLTSSIAHLLSKTAPPSVFSHEPYPPLASQNNVTILNELKRVVCSNILSWPLELPCRKLVCTRCVVERVAASTTDVLVQSMGCHRDVKAGSYEGHECTPSLTAGEEREAAALLKRAISTSSDKGTIQLPTEGALMDFMHLTKANNRPQLLAPGL
ncbi:hypothetical protein EMCRGX_G007427 [Ephydatia muelleri]